MTARFLDPEEVERFREGINSDPEFRLAARFMSKDVLLGVGSSQCIARVRDGTITELKLAPTIMDSWSFAIKAPAEAWDKLLQPLPPPFYNGLYAGMIRGTFLLEGDLEAAFAHFPAVTRMLDLLRQIQNGRGNQSE